MVEANPRGLRVEHRTAPENVVPDAPRFAWRCEGDRGAIQSAYRVQVARTRDALEAGEADCWDSGRVESDRSTGVSYDGVPLAGDDAYWWRVRVWDGEDDPSDWSDPAYFGTALDDDAAWAGEWVGYPGDAGPDGYRSAWLPDDDDAEAWVGVDLGASCDVSEVALTPAAPFRVETPDGATVTPRHAPDGSERVDGFGFPRAYRVEVADDPDFAEATVVAERDGVEPDASVRTLAADARGRYVRVVATEPYRVDPDRSNVDVELAREEYRPVRVFALAELTVLDADGVDLARESPVTASSAAETDRWAPEALVDGQSPGLACDSPRFRTEFECSTEIARARAHVVGLGYGELYLNGERVGDARLDPPWTDYEERVLYRTYDVTDYLAEGENAAGLWLGRGRFSQGTRGWAGFGAPRARLHLTVEYADGTTRTLGTDDGWTAAPSPVVANDVYDGERYDARREEPGWADAGFEGDWEPVATVPGPGGDLFPQQIPAMGVVETFDPVAVHDHEDGPIVDFGQNLTGWVELTVRGADAGEEVTLRHAEALTDDGDLSTVDLRSAAATDTYLAAGDGAETYEPRFTYHGFRYAQVEDYPGDLQQADVTAKAVTTAMERRGEFDCSNEDLRQVQHNAVWGLRGNTHSVPEDCPQRDERFGWTGDAHITSRALEYNFEAARFHEKWLRDHADLRSRHGYVSDTIPRGFGRIPGDPTWTITQIVVPWHLYQHHGDRAALREHYEGMRRYVDFWHSLTEDGLLPGEYARYGDWLAFEKRDGRRGLPFELFTTAYHYRAVDLLARIADVLGQDSDAERYREQARHVAAAFNDEYLNDDGTYGPGTQSGMAVPLFFGMVPEDRESEVVDALVEKVRDDGERLMTGFLGTRPLLSTLVDHGHADLAYRVVSQPEQPGWVYMARQGATTMWEHWDSDEQVGSGMNSLNHSPFTFVSEWFYEVLAGIRFRDAYDTGFEVAPTVVEDLDWAEASVETRHGTVESRWEREDGAVVVEVTVPWNTTATVRLPGETARVDGVDPTVEAPDGVDAAHRDDGEVVAHVGAGDYRFVVE